jgi:two-component system sensor histidine kinase KdpD
MKRASARPLQKASDRKDRVEAALGGWFQMGNLAALREIALLWLASTLAGSRGHLPGGGEPGRGQTRERVVVALSRLPSGLQTQKSKA